MNCTLQNLPLKRDRRYADLRYRCGLCGYPTHGLYCRYCLTGPEDGQGGE